MEWDGQGLGVLGQGRAGQGRNCRFGPIFNDVFRIGNRQLVAVCRFGHMFLNMQ